nr:SARP family transcriptional regulator [Actinomycetota bacterium]
MDAIWGDAPPERAANALQVYVHGLRKALGSDRVVTRGPGYELRVEPEELDLHRFERLVAQGAQALEEKDAARAAAALRDALALWRGAALGDLADEPFAGAESARLEGLRLAALEQRIAADLELGSHDHIGGELEGLIAEYPFRERLRCHQVLALYRSGRQADALAAYQRARQALVEELGIEPGPELQELERRILQQ